MIFISHWALSFLFNLSSGNSRLLKDYLVCTLEDEVNRNGVLTTAERETKSFSQAWRRTWSLITTINQSLQAVERSSLGHGLSVDYFNGESAGRVTAFFNATGGIGLLEALNDKALDMGLLFIGASLDRLSGIDCSSEKIVYYVRLAFQLRTSEGDDTRMD